MLRPPMDSDDDYDEDDYYEGFSFGDEFEKDKPKRQYYAPAENPERIRETKLEKLSAEGNVDRLCEYLRAEYGSEVGFDVNKRLSGNWTMLFYACLSVRLDMVKFLLINNADVNLSIDLQTPLMCVTKCTDRTNEDVLRIVQLLVDKGAVINVSDRNGVTPFMLAAMNGHLDICKLFLANASLEASDNKGNSALFHAVENNHGDVADLLIKAGVHLTMTNADGYTPQLVAKYLGYSDIEALFPVTEEEYQVPINYYSYTTISDLVPTALGTGQTPAYFQDIGQILAGIKCDKLVKYFALAKVSLPELLCITDSRLEAIGITYPFQRNKILLGILKFHLHAWSPLSIRCVAKEQREHFYDYFIMFSGHLKHLIVLHSTLRYLIDQRIVVQNEVADRLDQTHRSIEEIENMIDKMKTRVKHLESLSQRTPPLYIGNGLDVNLPAKLPKIGKQTKYTVSSILAIFSAGLVVTICWRKYIS